MEDDNSEHSSNTKDAMDITDESKEKQDVAEEQIEDKTRLKNDELNKMDMEMDTEKHQTNKLSNQFNFSLGGTDATVGIEKNEKKMNVES